MGVRALLEGSGGDCEATRAIAEAAAVTDSLCGRCTCRLGNVCRHHKAHTTLQNSARPMLIRLQCGRRCDSAMCPASSRHTAKCSSSSCGGSCCVTSRPHGRFIWGTEATVTSSASSTKTNTAVAALSVTHLMRGSCNDRPAAVCKCEAHVPRHKQAWVVNLCAAC